MALTLPSYNGSLPLATQFLNLVRAVRTLCSLSHKIRDKGKIVSAG
jgi:hypothetical protein